MYREVQAMFQIEDATERMHEALALRKRALVVREEIRECQQDTISSLLPAGLDGCNDLIRKHNNLTNDAVAIEAQVKTQLELYEKISSVNRMKWRSCN